MNLLSPTDPDRRPRLVVDSDDSCNRLLERLASVREAAIDQESTVGNIRSLTRPLSVQLYWGHEEVFVTEPYIRNLKPWLDSKPTTVFYGAKGDMWSLHNVGMPLKGDVVDVMMEDYLVNENVKAAGEFEESVKQRHADIFGHTPRQGYKKRFAKRGKPLRNIHEVLHEEPERKDEIINYGCADARETWELHENRKARLLKLPWKADLSMHDYFKRYSARYTKVLYQMERRGVYVDTEFLEELHGKATTLLERIESDFYTEARRAGGDLEAKKFTNKLLGSWQQIGRLFYDVIGYPEQFHLVKNKHTGQKERKRATDENALDKLARMGYPLAKILMERRKYAHLDSTYVEGLLKLVYKHRLHTDFTQAFTLTGRLSSRHPNLQNIPRPEEDPFGIRFAFIPTPGYSQIETRLMAHMSNDPDMIAACEGADIYVTMAAVLFNKPLSFFAQPKVGEAGRFRQITKAIVLGVGYGKQAKSIASDLGITEPEAEAFLSMYFGRFPRFRAWMKKTTRDCRDVGFVRTIHGRYRNIPAIRSSNKWEAMRAERQALNSRIQGSAFEVIQKAQLNIEDSGIEKEYGCHVILSVHDELLFEGPADVLRNSDFIPRVKEMMEHPFDQDLRVQIPVSGMVGTSWGEVHG
jgi:DNA polymerase I-like protein with 3'-5' exonuclease and polymerase domains